MPTPAAKPASAGRSSPAGWIALVAPWLAGLLAAALAWRGARILASDLDAPYLVRSWFVWKRVTPAH